MNATKSLRMIRVKDGTVIEGLCEGGMAIKTKLVPMFLQMALNGSLWPYEIEGNPKRLSDPDFMAIKLVRKYSDHD